MNGPLLCMHLLKPYKVINLKKGVFTVILNWLFEDGLSIITGPVKISAEVFVDPVIFETEPEEETDNISVHLAVVKQVTVEKDDSLKLEIAAANETLSHYGFTFLNWRTAPLIPKKQNQPVRKQ